MYRIAQELFEKLKLDGEEVTFHKAGFHGTLPIQSEKSEATLVDILSKFVVGLQHFGHSSDLFSLSNLEMVTR